MDEQLNRLRVRYSLSSLPGQARATMDDEVRDRLARLGYIFDRPPSDAIIEPAPDVKDMIHLEKNVERALR